MDLPVYLDYAATTPCDPGVVDIMLPFFGEQFGNPASRFHRYGWESDEAVGIARSEIARLIGAKPGEICFTSGATESTNLAIRGLLKGRTDGRNHLITLATEHKCVLETIHQLEQEGFAATVMGVNSHGLPDLNEIDAAFRPKTAMICAMYANNETGMILPVQDIAALAKRHNVPFFCDATQAVGKTMVDVRIDGIAMMAFTAHKIYGPKGIGALYVKGGIQSAPIRPLITGGKQEQGLRGGTLNVPGIVGFGKAAQLCRQSLSEEYSRIADQQQFMEEALMQLPGVFINGDPHRRLPHITNLSIEGVDSEKLLLHLSSKLALGTGSACSAITREPSHVLSAMGVTGDLLNGSIRISQGRSTTQEQISFAAIELTKAIAQLRHETTFRVIVPGKATA
jgi:cysteine desulfurase